MMLAAVALSACENTPDNIRSNKHSAEVDSGEAYVSSENIYDSFDAAFEKEYTKFKLPEKSAVSICKPDGVYDLELAYINAENDMDWLSSKVEELQSALDIKIDGKIETVEDQAQLQDEHNKLKITRFAQPYCCRDKKAPYYRRQRLRYLRRFRLPPNSNKAVQSVLF